MTDPDKGPALRHMAHAWLDSLFIREARALVGDAKLAWIDQRAQRYADVDRPTVPR